MDIVRAEQPIIISDQPGIVEMLAAEAGRLVPLRRHRAEAVSAEQVAVNAEGAAALHILEIGGRDGRTGIAHEDDDLRARQRIADAAGDILGKIAGQPAIMQPAAQIFLAQDDVVAVLAQCVARLVRLEMQRAGLQKGGPSNGAGQVATIADGGVENILEPGGSGLVIADMDDGASVDAHPILLR